MLRVVTNIVIEQRPSLQWPNRKTTIGLDFCNTWEYEDSWRDLTNKGKMIIPKNLYFRDQFGKLKPLLGPNINVGGFSSSAPLVLRGDKVSLIGGYKYFASKNAARETTTTNSILTGYVSRVSSAIPIEIEIEDNMWLLKQTPVDTRTFKSTDSLNIILKSLIDKCNSIYKTSFTVNALSKTTFGSFTMGNETACQVLQRLQKTYGFESYFRGDELRCGAIIYIPTEARTSTFTFQEDIIESDLQYVRKDDITLSAIAKNTIEERTGQITKDGFEKTKRKRLEVLVTLRDNTKTTRVIKSGDVVPENNEGERRTFHFPGAKTTQELSDAAFNELTKYYYTGLKGSFTTFGLPFVRQGDNVVLKNPILPEQDGTYKVKKVEYSGGINGMRQVIHLDFKINI